jgi:hypothetical protein
MTAKKRAAPHGLCGSPRKKGRPACTQRAGWGTTHPGLGRCKLHGGLQEDDGRVKHGLYSPVMQALLKKREGQWDESAARAIDLSEEISTLRLLASDLGSKKKLNRDAFLTIIDRITRAVSAQQQMVKQGLVSLETVNRYLEAIGLVIARHVKERNVLERIEADLGAIPLLAR